MSQIDINPEVDVFLPIFNASEDTLGTAHLSPSERKILRELRIEAGSHDEFVRRLWEEGYPIPESVTAQKVGETAATHGCIVAQYLLEQRGTDAYPNTYWSYVVKNAADRQIKWLLQKDPKTRQNSEFWKDWYEAQPRKEGYYNSAVRYPTGVDDSKIYGVAKVHRYWPAQLLRYMEAIRLEKVSDEEIEELKLKDINPKLYRLDWRDSWLTDALKDVETINDVPVNIALKVIEVMQERKVGDEQIVALILKGYSPAGPIWEHGYIPAIEDIWEGILDKVEDPIKTQLQNGIDTIYENISKT